MSKMPRNRRALKHDEKSGALHALVKVGDYSPSLLYGTSAVNPGLLYQLGKQPTVFDIMSSRKDAVESTDIEVYATDPTLDIAAEAAAVLNMVFEGSNLGLRGFLAETFDSVGKFGFCLYNIVFTVTGELKLIRIPHYHIREWYTDDADTIERVRCHNGSEEYYLEKGTFVWFGDQQHGVYWGDSLLVSLLPYFILHQQQILNDAESRAFAKGLVYIKGVGIETGGVHVTPAEESVNQSLDLLEDWISGTNQALYLPAGLEVAMTQGMVSTADAIQNYGQFKEIAREALGSTLKNLGSDGSGSLALGVEVSDADEKAFSNAVDSFLTLVNGTKHENSNLLDLLLDQLGYTELVGKRAVGFQMSTDDVGNDFAPENLPILLQYVQAGLVDFTSLTGENKKRVYQALGLEYTEPEVEPVEEEPQDAPESTETLEEEPSEELSAEDPYIVPEELRAYIEASLPEGSATSRALAREILTNPDLDTAKEVVLVSKRNVSEANWAAIGGDLVLDWARKIVKSEERKE